MDEDRDAFKIVSGKPTGKRALGRIRRRYAESTQKECVDNTRTSRGLHIILSMCLEQYKNRTLSLPEVRSEYKQ